MRALALAAALVLPGTALAGPGCSPLKGDLSALALTGRVVDDADLLNADRRRLLREWLAGHDGRTGGQLVVVPIRDLGGGTVGAFTCALLERWGIGRSGVDDGIGSVVAPHARRVRLEVGPGLQSVPTDAHAAAIVRTAMLPHFARGRFGPASLNAGLGAIVATVGNTAVRRPTARAAAQHRATARWG